MSRETLVWVLVSLAGIVRLAFPVQRCPVTSPQNVVHYITQRWSPWSASCGWGWEVDALATGIQLLMIFVVGYTLIRLVQDRARARA